MWLRSPRNAPAQKTRSLMNAAAIPASLFNPVPLAAFARHFTRIRDDRSLVACEYKADGSGAAGRVPYTFEPAGYHVVKRRDTMAPVVDWGSLYWVSSARVSSAASSKLGNDVLLQAR